MGTKTPKLESLIVRLAIDVKKVRSYVAVAVIAPFAAQRMVEIPGR